MPMLFGTLIIAYHNIQILFLILLDKIFSISLHNKLVIEIA
jgi:hypothetical protein